VHRGDWRIAIGFLEEWGITQPVVQAVAWLIVTLTAWIAARSHNVAQHRMWVARSYGLTFVFVTSRLVPDLFFPAADNWALNDIFWTLLGPHYCCLTCWSPATYWFSAKRTWPDTGKTLTATRFSPRIAADGQEGRMPMNRFLQGLNAPSRLPDLRARRPRKAWAGRGNPGAAPSPALLRLRSGRAAMSSAPGAAAIRAGRMFGQQHRPHADQPR